LVPTERSRDSLIRAVGALIREVGMPVIRHTVYDYAERMETTVICDMIDGRTLQIPLDHMAAFRCGPSDTYRRLQAELDSAYHHWLDSLNWRHLATSGRLRAMTASWQRWDEATRGMTTPMEEVLLPEEVRARWEVINTLLRRNRVDEAMDLAEDALAELVALKRRGVEMPR
jgi:hypothetical protein